jgi:hypothetical protein
VARVRKRAGVRVAASDRTGTAVTTASLQGALHSVGNGRLPGLEYMHETHRPPVSSRVFGNAVRYRGGARREQSMLEQMQAHEGRRQAHEHR